MYLLKCALDVLKSCITKNSEIQSTNCICAQFTYFLYVYRPRDRLVKFPNLWTLDLQEKPNLLADIFETFEILSSYSEGSRVAYCLLTFEVDRYGYAQGCLHSAVHEQSVFFFTRDVRSYTATFVAFVKHFSNVIRGGLMLVSTL